MKNKIIALLIGMLTIMPVAAFAKGPYKSLDHRNDGVSTDGSTHILANWAAQTALEIKNKGGEKFVQWYRGRHSIWQCTEGMNPDAIQSKLDEGWKLWSPGTSDPRYDWCGNNIFIGKVN